MNENPKKYLGFSARMKIAENTSVKNFIKKDENLSFHSEEKNMFVY